MSTHRGYYKLWKEDKMNKVMSFELFDKYGIENCYISLIENVNAKTKDELLAREAYYIKSMNCLNKVVPLRTYNEWKDDNQQKLNDYCKEYYENNKKEIISKVKIYSSQNQEKIKDYKKKYREEKKEEIYAKQKEKIICECGFTYTKQNKKRHYESKKHLKYLDSINGRSPITPETIL